MTDDQPTCTCQDTATILRSALEGVEPNPCVIHRPNRYGGQDKSAPALNSDALTKSVTSRLPGATTTTNL